MRTHTLPAPIGIAFALLYVPAVMIGLAVGALWYGVRMGFEVAAEEGGF